MFADWERNEILALVGIVVATLGIAVAIWIALRRIWQNWIDILRIDKEKRAKRVEELRGSRFARLYPDYLGHALSFAEHSFGPARSARALNVCTLLALIYSFVFFYLAYALGVPGRLGEEMTWFSSTLSTSSLQKIGGALIAILVPLGGLFLAIWLTRSIVKWLSPAKAFLREWSGIEHAQFEILLRILCALLVESLSFAIAEQSIQLDGQSVQLFYIVNIFILSGVFFAGASFGHKIAQHARQNFQRSLYAFITMAIVIYVVIFVFSTANSIQSVVFSVLAVTAGASVLSLT